MQSSKRYSGKGWIWVISALLFLTSLLHAYNRKYEYVDTIRVTHRMFADENAESVTVIGGCDSTIMDTIYSRVYMVLPPDGDSCIDLYDLITSVSNCCGTLYVEFNGDTIPIVGFDTLPAEQPHIQEGITNDTIITFYFWDTDSSTIIYISAAESTNSVTISVQRDTLHWDFKNIAFCGGKVFLDSIAACSGSIHFLAGTDLVDHDIEWNELSEDVQDSIHYPIDSIGIWITENTCTSFVWQISAPLIFHIDDTTRVSNLDFSCGDTTIDTDSSIIDLTGLYSGGTTGCCKDTLYVKTDTSATYDTTTVFLPDDTLTIPISKIRGAGPITSAYNSDSLLWNIGLNYGCGLSTDDDGNLIINVDSNTIICDSVLKVGVINSSNIEDSTISSIDISSSFLNDTILLTIGTKNSCGDSTTINKYKVTKIYFDSTFIVNVSGDTACIHALGGSSGGNTSGGCSCGTGSPLYKSGDVIYLSFDNTVFTTESEKLTIKNPRISKEQFSNNGSNFYPTNEYFSGKKLLTVRNIAEAPLQYKTETDDNVIYDTLKLKYNNEYFTLTDDGSLNLQNIDSSVISNGGISINDLSDTIKTALFNQFGTYECGESDRNVFEEAPLLMFDTKDFLLSENNDTIFLTAYKNHYSFVGDRGISVLKENEFNPQCGDSTITFTITVRYGAGLSAPGGILRIQEDNQTNNGLNVSGDGISVNVDDTTITISDDNLTIAEGGIDTVHFNEEARNLTINPAVYIGEYDGAGIIDGSLVCSYTDTIEFDEDYFQLACNGNGNLEITLNADAISGSAYNFEAPLYQYGNNIGLRYDEFLSVYNESLSTTYGYVIFDSTIGVYQAESVKETNFSEALLSPPKRRLKGHTSIYITPIFVKSILDSITDEDTIYVLRDSIGLAYDENYFDIIDTSSDNSGEYVLSLGDSVIHGHNLNEDVCAWIQNNCSIGGGAASIDTIFIAPSFPNMVITPSSQSAGELMTYVDDSSGVPINSYEWITYEDEEQYIYMDFDFNLTVKGTSIDVILEGRGVGLDYDLYFISSTVYSTSGNLSFSSSIEQYTITLESLTDGEAGRFHIRLKLKSIGGNPTFIYWIKIAR